MVCKSSIIEATSIYGDSTSKLIELTLKDMEKFYTSIQNAVKFLDSEELGLSAHSLKSVLSQAGAMDAAALAYELEKIGKSNDLQDADGLLQKLEIELKETKIVFEDLK